MYHIKLPEEMMAELWKLREHCGRGSIASQVREAVYRYLHQEEEKLGCAIKDFGDEEADEDSR